MPYDDDEDEETPKGKGRETGRMLAALLGTAANDSFDVLMFWSLWFAEKDGFRDARSSQKYQRAFIIAFQEVARATHPKSVESTPTAE